MIAYLLMCSPLVLMWSAFHVHTRCCVRTETKVCEEALGAEGGIAVQYIWNDALYTSPKRLEGPPAGQGAKEQWSDVDFEHSQPWTRYLLQKQPGLVVLNLGA